MSTRKPRWWVYILRCADDTFYTGITTNPERRLEQHNAGTASRYTRSRRPVVMIYRQPAPGHGPALRREAAIKKLARGEKEKLLAGTKPAVKKATRSQGRRIRGGSRSAASRGALRR